MGSITIPDYCTFDIETQNILEPFETSVSVIAIIDSDGTYHTYFEGEEHDAVRHLFGHKGIVSYNGRAFDIKVLQQFCRRAEGQKLRYMRHYDLLHEWMVEHRQYNSLKNFAYATLNMDKFPNTTAGPILQYKTAQRDKLLVYNYWDTYLTYLLWLYVETHGCVWCDMPTRRQFFPRCIGRIA